MSMEQYLKSTLTELILSTAGYWRNWERTTAWLMREIVFTMISGNPNIKKSSKPSKYEIMRLSTDPKNRKFNKDSTVTKALNFENKLKDGKTRS